MKHSKMWRRSTRNTVVRLNPYRALLLIVFGVIGVTLVTAGQAATHAVNAQVETAAVGGNAVAVTQAAASAGKAVLFGPSVAAPTRAVAYPGGTSIALRWNPSTSANVVRYGIFRDGASIGSVDPTVFNAQFPEKDGCGFIDASAAVGQTYRYQVQAQDSSGRLSALSSPVTVTQPTASQPVPNIIVDTSQAPDLANHINTTVVPFMKTWYPKLANELAYPDYTAPTTLTIILDPTMTDTAGVTFSTSVMKVKPQFLRDEPRDMGIWFHESVHLMQAYDDYFYNNSTSWMVEGMADWGREYMLQDRPYTEPGINVNSYTSGYGGSAVFLEYLRRTYGKDFIRKINVAAKAGTYSEALIKTYTGKTLIELQILAKGYFYGLNSDLAGTMGLCAVTAGNATADFTRTQLNTCTNASMWRPYYFNRVAAPTDMEMIIYLNDSVGFKCLDVQQSGTADQTPVWIYGCNRSGAQRWKAGPNESLINTYSGKCLDTVGRSTAPGTNLVIATCNGTATQRWTVP